MSLRDPRRIHSWRAFGRGFRQRSPFVLVAALVLVAAVCAGLESLARDGNVSGVNEGRWVRFRNDDSGHLAHLMASLKKSPPGGAVVYLLGGSATMESFVDEQSLGAGVGRHAGERVRVISLAGHAQSMGGSLVLVENLPKASHGLLAVGLAPARFTASPQDDSSLLIGYPYLLSSQSLRAILEDTPATLARADVLFPGAIKYGVTYLEERVRIRLPAFSDIGYNRHYTIDGPLFPLWQKLEWARRDSQRDVARYALYADYNFKVLQELVVLARQRGFDVVFYDQPLNGHIIGPTWRGLVPAYRRRAEALAARLGVPYLRVGRVVPLSNADFLDDYHLVVSGRLKWQPVLSAELGRRLRATPAGVQGPTAGR